MRDTKTGERHISLKEDVMEEVGPYKASEGYSEIWCSTNLQVVCSSVINVMSP